MATFSQIVTSMINYILGKKPDVDTSVGTVLRDVTIECPANEITNLYTEIDTTREMIAFYDNASLLTTDQLDSIANNYGLTRSSATTATGQVRFIKYTIPTSDIVIPQGTIVSTSSTTNQTSVNFYTLSQITMSVTSYIYDSVRAYYYVNGDIQCTAAGSSGNVAADTITTFSSLAGIDLVSNILPTTGGSDSESNANLAGRIRTKLMGNNYGTKNGYISLVSTISPIVEVMAVGPNDPGMLRSEYGGKVDVFVRPSSYSAGLVSESENIVFVSGTNTYVLTYQPIRVSSSATVTGTYLGSAHTFVETSDFVLSADTGQESGSNRAADSISWVGNKPDDGTVFTITYNSVGYIATAQDLIDGDTYHILTADALVREAERALVDATISIVKLTGYTLTSVSSSVTSAFTSYITALPLGSNLDESDIVNAIYDNAIGVDSVILPFTLFQKRDLQGTHVDVDGRIEASKGQYFGVGTLTISVR